MRVKQVLFSDGELSSFLGERMTNALKEIQGQDPEYILKVNPNEFCKYIFERHSLEPIALDEGKIEVDQQEKQVDVSDDRNRWIEDRSRPFYLAGTMVTYFIPFQGNSELFRYRSSTYTWNPPQGIIGNQVLELEFEGVNITSEDIKKEFERQFAEIKRWIIWVSNDARHFNEQLSSAIEAQVKARRENLLQARGVVTELGFPLKKREHMPMTYAVPEIKRKIIPKPSASTEASKPEPNLSLDDYNHILSVINNMALVMERSPRAFQAMKEEDIRQHFLVQLNGHYEGQATGETFNYEGKTDILIRYQGKIFS